MDNGGGAVRGGVRDKVGWRQLGLLCSPVCGDSRPCHTLQRQGGREAGSPPHTPLHQHATAAPGSCISHAWPLRLSSRPFYSGKKLSLTA